MRPLRAIAVLAALAAAAPALGGPPPKPKIAILKFSTAKAATGQATVADGVLEAATSFAQADAETFGLYHVMSHSDLEATLGVQAQRMKLGCTDDSNCIAEIAGALGVERILVGKLNRVGSSVVIDLVIINAKNASRMSHVVYTHSGGDESLMNSVHVAAKQLFDAHLPVITGYLEVNSVPPGIQVSIEGTPLGPTPVLATRRVREGKRQLTFRTATGELVREVEVKVGQVAVVMLDPKKPEGIEITYRAPRR